MRDLGYKRTPTTAMYRIDMGEGYVYDVPVQIIADDRDANYADDEEDTIGFILNGSLDEYNIKDWATNNMNWDDVKQYATRVEVAHTVDHQDGWVNGSREVIGLGKAVRK